MLRRSEIADRLVLILLTVMALALIIFLPPSLTNNAQSATESLTESEPATTLVEGEQTLNAIESTSGSKATGGHARNRTSITINTSLPADVSVNGDEVALPVGEDLDETVVTDTGSILNLSLNTDLTDDGDLDIKIKSKSDVDIDQNEEWSIESSD